MSSDRDEWKGLKRILAMVIAAICLAFMIPGNIAAEKQGVPNEGVLVRYQSSRSGRYFYPIVQVTVGGRTEELKSARSWRWKWYELGDRVPILVVSGRECYVGPVLLRWGDVFLMATALAVLATWTFGARRKAANRIAPTQSSEDKKPETRGIS